jgi:cold shock CspA family protein
MSKSGTVKFFNDKKGFGFIIPMDGSEDVFVHRTDVVGNELLQEDKVQYEETFDQQKNKTRATKVTGGTGVPVGSGFSNGKGFGGGGKGFKGGGMGGFGGGGKGYGKGKPPVSYGPPGGYGMAPGGYGGPSPMGMPPQMGPMGGYGGMPGMGMPRAAMPAFPPQYNSGY